MRKIAIYGAGGFGKDISFLIESINDSKLEYDLIGYFDDGVDKGDFLNGYPVLGNLEDLKYWQEEIYIIFAISKPKIIEAIYSNLQKNENIKYPNIYHPNCSIDMRTLSIGQGNVFNVGCIVSRDVVIGDFNIYNTRVAIGHDVNVGSFNHFGPNVQISGGVILGNRNVFSLNSCIIQYKKVGNDNTIGACSLVIRNVADGNVVFGVPATNSKF